MAFEGTGNAVKAKLGPFPVWVWGLIIGGAFVVWYWVSQGGGGSGEPVEDSTDDGTVAPPSGDFSTVPVLPTTPGDSAQDEATNAEWLIQAVEAASQSGVSFVGAQTALMKYLNGQTLTDAERKIVDSAIARVGLPPEGVASTPDVTPPEATPEPAKPVTKNFATKTTISAGWIRNPLIIRVKVDWVDPKGHTWKPRGTVNIGINGTNRKQIRLANGSAIRPVVVGRNKALVITATYHPAKGVSEKSSKASPLALRTK